YRFRHEDQTMFFDVVTNGKFCNGCAQQPFFMELGRDYHVEIKAMGRHFVIYIYGIQVISAVDPNNTFPEGSIAVILWEDDGETPISTCIDQIKSIELIKIPVT